ncbi:VOC family protein [Kocuria sp. CPCC 205316]|uniref:VOC family protein n=1 Tax=Kocuria TaxID=57493 RepID=UPI0036DAADF4
MATCLMFACDQHGRAEEAMTLCTSVFGDSWVLSVYRHGSGEEEAEGTVRAAWFVLAGRAFPAMDSGRPHPFGFTPARSSVVDAHPCQGLQRAGRPRSARGQAVLQ